LTVVPDLITDRLLLRAWTPEEVGAVVGGKRLPHWVEDFPSKVDKIRSALFEKNPGWYGTHGHRQIIERESGQVVGGTGLFTPQPDGTAEFGYGIAPSRQRRGYATEAARALIAHGLTSPDIKIVFAKVSLDNPASIRVLEKAGLVSWPDLELEPGLTAFRTP
jgi:RimJ/RimL family protein N-acetyltransferase